MSTPAVETGDVNNPISLYEQQQHDLNGAVALGNWRMITEQFFGEIHRIEPDTLKIAREQSFDIRLQSISLQLNQIEKFESLFDTEQETLAQINGDKQHLRLEVAAIFKARYPTAEPLPPNVKESLIMNLNRDVNAAIQFFIAQGEVEALTPAVIPELALLREKTLIELKIDALFARMERYDRWDNAWDAISPDPTGFPLKESGKAVNSPLERVVKKNKLKTKNEIDELALRLEELDTESTI
jgi:hypothetical protein